MRAARKLQVVPPNPVQVAREAHDAAKVASESALRVVEELRPAESAAIADAGVSEEEAGRLTVRLRRAVAQHAQRVAEEEQARKALDAAERERDAAELEERLRHIEALTGRIAPVLSELRGLRDQLWGKRQGLADLVVDVQEAHERATELAARLERPAEVQRRVGRATMADVVLLLSVAFGLDDERTERECPSDVVRALRPSAVEWNSPQRPAIDAAIAAVERMEK